MVITLVNGLYVTEPIEIKSSIFNMTVSVATAGTVKILISDSINGDYTEVPDIDQYVVDKYSMNIKDGVVGQYMKVVSAVQMTDVKIQWDGNYFRFRL